jgi:hypothetical protein
VTIPDVVWSAEEAIGVFQLRSLRKDFIEGKYKTNDKDNEDLDNDQPTSRRSKRIKS